MTAFQTHVTFRHLAHSDALEAFILERVTDLERFCRGLLGCRALIEVPHRHRQHGRHFHVRLEFSVPGRPPVVISHEPSVRPVLNNGAEPAHRKDAEIDTDLRHAFVAVREAFDIARRLLLDVSRVQRGEVKTHMAWA